MHTHTHTHTHIHAHTDVGGLLQTYMSTYTTTFSKIFLLIFNAMPTTSTQRFSCGCYKWVKWVVSFT